MNAKFGAGSAYLDVEQAAVYLGVGVRFIRRLVAERRVRFYKLGVHVRFKVSDLDAFADAGMVDAAPRFRKVG